MTASVELAPVAATPWPPPCCEVLGGVTFGGTTVGGVTAIFAALQLTGVF